MRETAARWRGRICRFEGSEYTPGPGNYWRTFDRVPDGDSASYGDFTPDDDGTYFLSDFLSGSDYSGCLVERANYRDFLADYGERDGVHEVYGGHGTYAVAVRIDAIDDEMAAVFEALEDYPLISDESHSELEIDAQSEAWENWAASDFRSALETEFEGDLEFEPAEQARLFETGERPAPADLDEAVLDLFEAARESANCYWEVETGGGVYIDLDRVVDAVTADMLAARGIGGAE